MNDNVKTGKWDSLPSDKRTFFINNTDGASIHVSANPSTKGLYINASLRDKDGHPIMIITKEFITIGTYPESLRRWEPNFKRTAIDVIDELKSHYRPSVAKPKVAPFGLVKGMRSKMLGLLRQSCGELMALQLSMSDVDDDRLIVEKGFEVYGDSEIDGLLKSQIGAERPGHKWKRRIKRGDHYLYFYTDEEHKQFKQEEQKSRLSKLHPVTQKLLGEGKKLSVYPPPGAKDVVESDGTANWVCRWTSPVSGKVIHAYPEDFMKSQAALKYEKTRQLAARLPGINKQIAKDIKGEFGSKRQVVALVSCLISKAYFRIGDERNVKKTGNYGITVLRPEHLKIEGNKMTFDYRGKKYQHQHHVVVDKQIAGMMKKMKAMSTEDNLFVYRDGGKSVPVTGDDVNSYLKEIGGMTAKSFRTLGGTEIAKTMLDEMVTKDHFEIPIEGKKRESFIKSIQKEIATRVSGVLGNTPSVALESYISPVVFDYAIPRIMAGSLSKSIGGQDVSYLDDVGEQIESREVSVDGDVPEYQRDIVEWLKQDYLSPEGVDEDESNDDGIELYKDDEIERWIVELNNGGKLSKNHESKRVMGGKTTYKYRHAKSGNTYKLEHDSIDGHKIDGKTIDEHVSAARDAGREADAAIKEHQYHYGKWIGVPFADVESDNAKRGNSAAAAALKKSKVAGVKKKYHEGAVDILKEHMKKHKE
jgi:DNA topoisomerase-1